MSGLKVKSGEKPTAQNRARLGRVLKLKLCQKPILAGYFNAARNEPFAVKHEGD